MSGEKNVLRVVWAAIPFFGAFAIGLAHGSALVAAIAGVPVGVFTAVIAYGGASAFHQEVWPQIKADIGGLVQQVISYG